MLEMQLVEHAALFPAACVCGSGAGPLVDTMMEEAHTGKRVYLCALCVRRAARLMGFVAGEEHDEAVAEIARLHEQTRHLSEDLEAARAEQVRVVSVEDLDALADKLAGRAKPEPVAKSGLFR